MRLGYAWSVNNSYAGIYPMAALACWNVTAILLTTNVGSQIVNDNPLVDITELTPILGIFVSYIAINEL